MFITTTAIIKLCKNLKFNILHLSLRRNQAISSLLTTIFIGKEEAFKFETIFAINAKSVSLIVIFNICDAL